MKKLLLLVHLSGFALVACNQSSKTEEVRSATENTTDAGNKDTGKLTKTAVNAAILNNIIVYETGGVQVSGAFLSYEDGSLVPKGNNVALRQPVYLNLIIKKGWHKQGGKVFIDASEKIETSEGQLVVNEPSLFKTKPAMEENKANAIQLKAVVTKTRAGIDYFLISYRVWDKKGSGEVKGSYKLFIHDKVTEKPVKL